MNTVRNAIDKSVSERDQNIDKFCKHLDKDIAELNKEVKAIKVEGQVISSTFCCLLKAPIRRNLFYL